MNENRVINLNKLKSDEPIGIYIHIPFCTKKCLYCDFVSFPLTQSNRVDDYILALLKEIQLYESVLSARNVKSIFIGGGTPSCIPGHYIANILNTLNKITAFKADIEITIEANPGTLTQEKINYYLNAGVNRMSMGLQSSDQKLLKSLGRQHNLNDFLTSYEAVYREGITNINIDLMFGLPGQNLNNLAHTLKLIKEINPKHISAYALKLEEGTPMYEAHQKGKLKLPEEAEEREMYYLIKESLASQGLLQYEISNFARPGFESKHNLIYWENKPYLGLGIASHSKINQTRFENPVIIETYIKAINEGVLPRFNLMPIDEEEELFETIMLGLRLNRGLNLNTVNSRFGIDFIEKYGEIIKKLIHDGLLAFDQEKYNLSLTLKGMDLSNQVFLAFMN